MKLRITGPRHLHALITSQGKSLQLGAAARPIAVLKVTQGLTGRNGRDGFGIPGATGDLTYTHDQAQAADVWAITHGLGKRPAVAVVDSAGDLVDGDVRYLDANSLQITFSSAFAGQAHLN